MNKIIYTILITIIAVLIGCMAFLKFRLDRITAIPPDKIQIMSSELTGAGKLILAEQKVYQEYIKAFKKGPVQAQVLFRWLTTFQYIVDTQSPVFKITMDGDTVKILSPAIVLNEPAIDISTYNAGKELLKDPRILKMCTDQIKLSVFKIASNLHLRVKDVEITFAAE